MSKVHINSKSASRSTPSMLGPVVVRSALVALASCLLPVAGCSSHQADSEMEATVLDGTVEMALTLEGQTINSVSISFESPVLTTPRSRVVNVTDPNATISFAEHGLPAGTYSIRLSASLANDATATCAGVSSGVVVVAGQITEVNDLVLSCTIPGGQVKRGGSVRVNARAEVQTGVTCTDLAEQVSVSALQTSVGASVNLVAVPVAGATVSWSANGGTLAANGASFTCPAVAGQVKLKASFVHTNGCTDSVEQVVSCVRAPQYRLGTETVQPTAFDAASASALYGIAFDSDGSFFTSGPFAAVAGGDQSTAVTKFKADGSVDTSFGVAGIAMVNIGANANEAFRGIAVQKVGAQSYIVVAGTTQFDSGAAVPNNLEQDTAVARFTSAGVLDTSFGTNGVVRMNLNGAVPNAAGTGLTGNESQWDLLATPDGKLILHGAQRSEALVAAADGTQTPATNTVYAMLRLNSNGTFDTSFSSDGKVLLDMGGTAGAGARTATLLADGSVVGVGYTSNAVGVVNQNPVLYKVTPSGEFDATFATQDAWTAPGVWHDLATPLPGRAEAYSAGPQGANFVTMGYGPGPVPAGATAGSTDFVSFRFTGAGVIDRTYGINSGATFIDGEGKGDNGRARVVVLPDNQVVGAGGGGRNVASGAAANTDGMIALLSEGGVPVTSFGAGGRRLVELGGANDFLHAAALSPDGSQVVFVGQGGTGTALKGVVVRLAVLPVN